MLDWLNNDKDNTASLINDFSQYYFGEKPVISQLQLKRVFFGSMTQTGLLALLKECILELGSSKSKTVLSTFCRLLDHSKSH